MRVIIKTRRRSNGTVEAVRSPIMAVEPRRGMMIECPDCGSRNVRPARLRSFTDKLMRWLGVMPARCRDCKLRFRHSLWQFGTMLAAKCPRCYSMTLSTWSEEYYIAPPMMRLLIGLGAKRYRCEMCRFNFASFRTRRYSSGKRWRDNPSGNPAGAKPQPAANEVSPVAADKG